MGKYRNEETGSQPIRNPKKQKQTTESGRKKRKTLKFPINCLPRTDRPTDKSAQLFKSPSAATKHVRSPGPLPLFPALVALTYTPSCTQLHPARQPACPPACLPGRSQPPPRPAYSDHDHDQRSPLRLRSCSLVASTSPKLPGRSPPTTAIPVPQRFFFSINLSRVEKSLAPTRNRSITVSREKIGRAHV